MTATFSITNAGGQQICARYLGTKGRLGDLGADASQYDRSFDWRQNFCLNPGDSYTYTASRSFDQTGTYTFTPNYSPDGSNWFDIKWPNDTVSYRQLSVQAVPQGQFRLASDLSLSSLSPAVNDPVTASFRYTNTGGTAVCAQYLGTKGRLGNLNADASKYDRSFNWDRNICLAPGETRTYTAQQSFDTVGSYSFTPNFSTDGSNWADIKFPNDQVSYRTVTVSPPGPAHITVVSGPSFSPAQPQAGQTVTACTTVTNDGGSPFQSRFFGVGGRGPGGDRDFEDFELRLNGQDTVIGAGKSYQYCASRAFSQPGSYRFYVTYSASGADTPDSWPHLTDDSTVTVGGSAPGNPRSSTGQAPATRDCIQAITSLTTSTSTPKLGQETQARFTAQNTCQSTVTLGRLGVAGRGPNDIYTDFAWVQGLSLGPGATYQYQTTRTFGVRGAHHLWISYQTTDGQWHDVARAAGVESTVTLTVDPLPAGQKTEAEIVSTLGDYKDPKSRVRVTNIPIDLGRAMDDLRYEAMSSARLRTTDDMIRRLNEEVDLFTDAEEITDDMLGDAVAILDAVGASLTDPKFVASLGVGLHPVTGPYYDLMIATSGQDPITRDRMPLWVRALSGVTGAIGVAGQGCAAATAPTVVLEEVTAICALGDEGALLTEDGIRTSSRTTEAFLGTIRHNQLFRMLREEDLVLRDGRILEEEIGAGRRVAVANKGLRSRYGQILHKAETSGVLRCDVCVYPGSQDAYGVIIEIKTGAWDSAAAKAAQDQASIYESYLVHQGEWGKPFKTLILKRNGSALEFGAGDSSLMNDPIVKRLISTPIHD